MTASPEGICRAGVMFEELTEESQVAVARVIDKLK